MNFLKNVIEFFLNELIVLGTPGREANFKDKAEILKAFSGRAAQTARMVAAGASNGNKKLSEALVSSAGQVLL